MVKPVKIVLAGLIAAAAAGNGPAAQPIRDGMPERGAEAGELPLRRVALFSSGVGYFEHSGTVSGPSVFVLAFNRSAVNDVLKSLIVNDPRSASPAVRYPSEDTVWRTMRSLRVDLSGNPGIAEILDSLRGAEMEISFPAPVSGRIIGVEYRNIPGSPPAGEGGGEAWVSLLTAAGIRMFSLRDIGAFSFPDPAINADFNRALDLLANFRAGETRDLRVELPGEGARTVSLSYVIPAPVWKVSYRLDLSGGESLLQGWAVVDNGGDADWENVELSLVTGRPVSFIQNLYPPLMLSRPTLPLAIAGIARAEIYDSSRPPSEPQAAKAAARVSPQLDYMYEYDDAETDAGEYERQGRGYSSPAPAPALAGGTVETAGGAAAGDQFEFTLKRPVSLARRQSAMFPLTEGPVKAEKALIFSASRLQGGGTIHPVSGAELSNTTGMKLPAGPLTVYEGGTYAGDALIEFFPAGEKRLVAWGEDLSVTGSAVSSSSRILTAAAVSGGVLTLSRKQIYERTYFLRNGSAEEKRLILEHPVTAGASLAAPASFEERTPGLYRFIRNLPAGGELSLTVREESPLSERISLAQMRPESFVSYASNQEIPAPVRAALGRAAELRREADRAQSDLRDLEGRRDRLVAEQDRIRKNLEAAGGGTPQGQEYLKRMGALDGEIDALSAAREAAAAAVKTAQAAYDTYLGTLNL